MNPDAILYGGRKQSRKYWRTVYRMKSRGTWEKHGRIIKQEYSR